MTPLDDEIFECESYTSGVLCMEELPMPIPLPSTIFIFSNPIRHGLPSPPHDANDSVDAT